MSTTDAYIGAALVFLGLFWIMIALRSADFFAFLVSAGLGSLSLAGLTYLILTT